MACTNESAPPNKDPDITGYIMDATGERILVVSKEAQNHDSDHEYYDAISLSGAPKEVEAGQLVNVWYDGPIAESYPMQSKVGELEIVSSAQPDGSQLTEAEVLKIAIEDQSALVAVRLIAFDPASKQWQIEFIEIPQGDTFKVTIEDK